VTVATEASDDSHTCLRSLSKCLARWRNNSDGAQSGATLNPVKNQATYNGGPVVIRRLRMQEWVHAR
jgi:hypothetical protein